MARRGPKTGRGREIAAQNATSHGIFSRAVVVPGMEGLEEWEDHRRQTIASLASANHLETILAERIALFLWRLARVARYEGEAAAMGQEKVDEDIAEARRITRSSPTASIWPCDIRGNWEFCRDNLRLLQRFPKLPDAARLSGDDAHSVLWCVARGTDGIDLDELTIPGIPDDVAWEDLPHVSVGAVRTGLEIIARARSESVDDLWEAALIKARSEHYTAKAELERVERDLDRKRRERLLPSDRTLDKVSRYEAHLSRELSKALRELQELQDRRQAQAQPPAGARIEETLEAEIVEPAELGPGSRPALSEGQNCKTNSPAAVGEGERSAVFSRNH